MMQEYEAKMQESQKRMQEAIGTIAVQAVDAEIGKAMQAAKE